MMCNLQRRHTGRVLLGLLALLVLHSAARATENTDNSAAPALKDNPVYRRYCGMCHGRDGSGGGFAPSLHARSGNSDNRDVRQRYLDTVMHGRRGMPAFANRLSDRDLANVIDAILSVRLGATHQKVTEKEIGVLRKR